MARSFIHDPNTAQMAPHSWSHGQVGKSSPVCFFTAALKFFTSSLRSSVVRSVSFFTPFLAFCSSMITSNGSWSSFETGFMPSTTSPYICTKRRYESQANRGLPVRLATASTAWSFMPRLRMVSIMPGIEARAPERTDTSSGISLSPNFMPVSFSMFFIALSTSGRSISMTASLPCL